MSVRLEWTTVDYAKASRHDHRERLADGNRVTHGAAVSFGSQVIEGEPASIVRVIDHARSLFPEAPPLIDARDAITRIQNMRDEAQKEADEYEAEAMERGGGEWDDAESEGIHDMLVAVVDTFERVATVLHLMAHGITPAQGEAV